MSDKENHGLQALVGKKIWVIQYDDDDDAVQGICVSVDEQFVALRMELETEPSLYINLTNVKEIEVYRSDESGEIRYLRSVKDDESQG